MNVVLKSTNKFLHRASFLSSIIDQCFAAPNPLNSLRSVHAQLIKVGLSSNVFICNRCIDVYVRYGSVEESVNAFHDIPGKNVFSWNLYLKVFVVKCLDLEWGRRVFNEMPERDTVTWNTLISGYISIGSIDSAWETFLEMRDCGVRPSEFTFSMVLCCVQHGNHVKAIHGCVVRSGQCFSNLVVGNSLIDVYGKLGLMVHALDVFLSMDNVDVISWNSLISGCCNSGNEQFALHYFLLMRSSGFEMDEYTVSAVLTACSDLRNLEKGKQVLCLCMKMGFLSNAVVNSAAIDFFSKCNQLESAQCVFEESQVLDSASCNSIIACCSSHNAEEIAMEFFVFSFRENVRPTEFTLSCILHSAAAFVPGEQGSHLHSLVMKTGFELDGIVASSLVEMYSKYGMIDSALKVFAHTDFRDLIAFNTLILALTHNGRPSEAISHFRELLSIGLRPDRITFTGVLLACNYGGFLQEGMSIFSSMKTQHQVEPINDHYCFIVSLLIRAGRIDGAIDLLHSEHLVPNAVMWESMLRACAEYGNLELVERVAEQLIELDPHSYLPYMILANAYEKRSKWESVVRVRRKMRKMATEELADFSWFSMKGLTFRFEANRMIHHGGMDVYAVLGLLMQEMKYEKELDTGKWIRNECLYW